MTHNDLRYEFGPYQLNPSKRILTRDGEGIPLTPKATEILLVLVKHAGQLVEKDEPLKDQAYLEGRYHWSRYTREEIEKAISHFRLALKLDPNYALAYAAVVDCYLRLTTYLPPEEDGSAITRLADNESDRIELRFEWDWKSVERELRRAADLKTNYTPSHQWYFVYSISKQLYEESFSAAPLSPTLMDRDSCLASQIPSVQLTPTEEVQILCSVARDQVAIGNFDAARLILRRWAVPRKWPRLTSLNPYAAADLLFMLGTLSGSVAGSMQVVHGHKQAESSSTVQSRFSHILDSRVVPVKLISSWRAITTSRDFSISNGRLYRKLFLNCRTIKSKSRVSAACLGRTERRQMRRSLASTSRPKRH